MGAMQPPVSIFDTLQHTPTARLGARVDLGAGRALAIWTNSDCDIRYETGACHTLSLYLDGGARIWRTDGRSGDWHGAPGTICLMPQGAPSEWRVGENIRMAHLYLPDDGLRATLAEGGGRAPDALSLPELTWAADAGLAEAMRHLLAAEGVLARSAALTALQARLLAVHAGQPLRPVRGGLGTATARRLRDLIEARLDQPLTLDTLAAEAGLSPWHFQRMFRVSFGVSPQHWVERRRLARAEAALATDTPLARIAAECGFCHQSHLTRAFRRARGITPGAFRRALRVG